MLTLTLRDRAYPVKSFREASEVYSRLRDESGEGASTFPWGFVSGNGAGVGVDVSYNGRVWDDVGACVYDPIPNSGPPIPDPVT